MSNHTAEVTHHVHRDDVGARMGMWLFLFTELLLFGGMFLVYAVYRHEYIDQFRVAAMALNTTVGALNTIILLTSSLTVALSIAALQKGNKSLSIMLLVMTNILAFAFMVNKYFEWSEKIHHGIFPGSETLLNLPDGQILFYGLYYIMTGLHGLHVIIGLIFLSIVLGFIITGSVNKDSYVKLENAGLYWHLVDLIWIFLFPLFYLIQ
ncbi:MAG: cytochrome c oxidase subunit 3 [Ignavibacteriales bacterium]|nr:cytochrome c oxidase subunit 3 [Ignavibacteriales bacterium]MCB9209713.1 cytochrome c oxidase subunit 3 [Ignavibacteriales bacterium]MCB9218869.1 cytochrome c oxidase subunit 3 [Ignavibacteriales bacterium]